MVKGRVLDFLILILFGLGIYATIEYGRHLHAPRPAILGEAAKAALQPASGIEPSASLKANLHQHLDDPLTRLLLQLILIVPLARGCGWLVAKAGQPAVVGEMLAGILIGPSLIGWLWPGFFEFLFPASSLGTLRMLSQLGICLFMFVVGMEFDPVHLKKQARTVWLVSQVSILFPYLLGVAAALALFPRQAGATATFLPFALFLGISLSITAFPVLARILEERGWSRTPLGVTAIACAAAGDVTAWSILAFVVAIVKAGAVSAAVLRIGLVVVFVGFMLWFVKPRMARWVGTAKLEDGPLGKGLIAGVIAFLLACALATDLMGVHALFGAFLAGVVMPARGEFHDFIRVRLEHFSSVFLLPLFFAFNGLRTQVGLLNDGSAWLLCLGLILLATLGKLGGATLTARATGLDWRNAFALGALMNTRGLIELIALNIGYDLGILSPRLFATLVIMALVTTAMTGPLLNFYERRRIERADL